MAAVTTGARMAHAQLARLEAEGNWVVDLARDVLIVHRLDAAGAYGLTEHTDGTADPRSAPGLAVPVAELVGRK